MSLNERTEPGFLLRCNPAGRIVEVLRDEVGLSAIARPGMAFSLVVAPSDLRKSLSFFAALRDQGDQLGWEITVLLAGEPCIVRLEGHRRDGDEVMVAGVLAPDSDGLLHRLSRMSNDQSSMVRDLQRDDVAPDDLLYRLSQLNNQFATLQRELARKNALLEMESERKSLALGIAAHDLRSPLNVICGYAELLEMRTAAMLSEAELGMIGMIRQTASYMLALIDSLLSLAETESSRLALEVAHFDFAELTRTVVSLDGELAKRRAIVLESALPANGLHLAGDRHKLQQVLHNLVGNAVKYSPAGARVYISLTDHGDTVRLAVKDHGAGIPEHEQHRLFQPFSRTSVRPPDGGTSTGLGLAICRNIVEAHGGTIGVDSIHGVGSTFYFTLPKVVAG
jgi:signal transduction histidine kinase